VSFRKLGWFVAGSTLTLHLMGICLVLDHLPVIAGVLGELIHRSRI